MDAVIQAFWNLVVDLSAKPGQATEGRLHVTARAAKTVVQVEVTEGGIEVIAPHQPNDAPSEPDAFRVAGRTVDDLGGFGEFVGFALVIPRGICRARGGLAGLVGVCRRPALGQRAAQAEHQGQSGSNEIAQNRKPTLKHPLTHKFPDLVPAQAVPAKILVDSLPGNTVRHVLPDTNPLITLAAQIGPECGGYACWNPMTEILDFCKQTHNFIVPW
jgi:hypothetical protein